MKQGACRCVSVRLALADKVFQRCVIRIFYIQVATHLGRCAAVLHICATVRAPVQAALAERIHA